MAQLVQLIYVSHASHLLEEAELRAILDASVRNNLRDQLTGMLLYANGTFLQILEGEASAVAETFTRIRADRRHSDIYELSNATAHGREFGAWSMGFRALTPTDAPGWPGYADIFYTGFDATRLNSRPGLALEMLKSFARENDR